MSESDYPAGAADDTRAPFNEKDHGECTECEGHGEVPIGPDHFLCNTCQGTGRKPEHQVRDEYESFKEDTKDE